MAARLPLHTLARVHGLDLEAVPARPARGRILISYVPGSAGEDALVLGRLLCEATGAQPLVHSVIAHAGRKHGHTERAQRKRSERLADVAEAAGRLLSDLDPVCTASAGHSARTELARLALEQRPGVVVLGSSGAGRSGFGLSGIATSFLHEVPCAVAVAPAGYAERQSPRLLRIAVAFDGGDEARVALESAVELAARTRARLSLIAAVNSTGGGLVGPFTAAGGGEGAGVVELQRGAMERVLRDGLQAVPDDMPVDSRLLLGPPAQIAEAAGEHDLLVLGSRGHGTVGRALLGSLSARLITDTSSPVLVLPRAAGDDPLGIRAESLPALV